MTQDPESERLLAIAGGKEIEGRVHTKAERLQASHELEQRDPKVVAEESVKLRSWAALLASTDEFGDVLEGTGALLQDVASVLKAHMDYDDYLLTHRKIETLGYLLGTAPSGAFPEITGLKLLVRDIADEVSLAAEHFAEYAQESLLS